MFGNDNDKIDQISSEIVSLSSDNEIPCERAFEISRKFDVSPLEVGLKINSLEIKISNCQLGLFGYKPEKKILVPAEDVSSSLENSIMNHLTNNRIFCKDVWEVANENSIGRMDAAAACEKLSIKIKKCQLGAF